MDIYQILCKKIINRNYLYLNVPVQIIMQRQIRGEKPIARAKDYNTVWRDLMVKKKTGENFYQIKIG